MERLILEKPNINSKVMLSPETAATVCRKLYDYEDTKLIPEQIFLRENDIKLLSKENKGLREEIFRLREELQGYRDAELTPEEITALKARLDYQEAIINVCEDNGKTSVNLIHKYHELLLKAREELEALKGAIINE